MRLLTDQKFKKIFVLAAAALETLFVLLFLLLGTKGGNVLSIFTKEDLDITVKVLHGFMMVLMILGIIFSVTTALLEITKGNLRVMSVFNSVFLLFLFILSIASKRYNIVFLLFGLLISVVLAVYVVFYDIKTKDAPTTTNISKAEKITTFVVLGLMCTSFIVSFLIFAIPVCYYDGEPYFRMFDALGSKASVVALVSFIDFFAIFIVGVVDIARTIDYVDNNKQMFYKKSRISLYGSFALTIAFFIFAVIIEYVFFKKQEFPVEKANTTAFIPMIITGVIAVVNSIVTAKFIVKKEKPSKTKIRNAAIAIVFTLGMIGLLVGSLFSNILVIKYYSGTLEETIKVNGFQLLSNSKNITATEYQMLAFLIYIALVVAIVLTVVCLVLYFKKSRLFFKLSLFSTITAFALLVCIGLFGKYYQIAEHINRNVIMSVIEYYDKSINIEYTSKITSETIYFGIGGLAMLVILAVLKPYSKHIRDEAIDININEADGLAGLGGAGGGGAGGLMHSDLKDSKIKAFDACPAFSEIDRREDEFNEDYNIKRQSEFKNVSLPSLVRFIVEYAKESRLHLSYKEEEIAQFIAGLGSSRLSILQGMSGTGKTSLPKIFAEAILGNVDLVEVESSWKDKNELIGYYNEFSGKFTPKKFTQALYKAKFSPDVITLIVLDEMNLSRIEYYFSDFLSLMENEEDKREIKLLNVQLKNIVNGTDISYKMLEHGHTLKIPTNVWFIGTANRDESTFEISDKVYDRAMTMNFSKRAAKIRAFNEPIPNSFLRYSVFKGLIDKALNSFHFDASTDSKIREVEKLLQPYNISFGNRIEKQIESFVSIYCSCFTEPTRMIDEAVEKILFSKVVAKLEFKSVENKEELAHSFEELGLLECAAFINKLNEDI